MAKGDEFGRPISLEQLERIARQSKTPRLEVLSGLRVGTFIPGNVQLSSGYFPGIQGAAIRRSDGSLEDASHRAIPSILASGRCIELAGSLKTIIETVCQCYSGSRKDWAPLDPIFTRIMKPFLEKGGSYPGIVWSVPYAVAWDGPRLPSVTRESVSKSPSKVNPRDFSFLSEGWKRYLGKRSTAIALGSMPYAFESDQNSDGRVVFVTRAKFTEDLRHTTMEHSVTYGDLRPNGEDPFESLGRYRFERDDWAFTATWVVNAIKFTGEDPIKYIQVWIDPVTQRVHRSTRVEMDVALFWTVMFPLITTLAEFAPQIVGDNTNP